MIQKTVYNLYIIPNHNLCVIYLIDVNIEFKYSHKKISQDPIYLAYVHACSNKYHYDNHNDNHNDNDNINETKTVYNLYFIQNRYGRVIYLIDVNIITKYS